jgi:hypothetical protein
VVGRCGVMSDAGLGKCLRSFGTRTEVNSIVW